MKMSCDRKSKSSRAKEDDELSTTGMNKKSKRRQYEDKINMGIFGDVYPIGLGTLPLGVLYPDSRKRPSEERAIDLIQQFVENGGRLIDTADSYCSNSDNMHYVEKLIAQAISRWGGNPDNVIVATKTGMTRFGDGLSSKSWRPADLTTTYLKDAIQSSRASLAISLDKTEKIGLFQIHHCDSFDCYVDSEKEKFIGILLTLLDAVETGQIRAVGLCNCSTLHIKIAHEVLGKHLVTIQNQYSLYNRDAERPSPDKNGGKVPKTNKMGVLNLCEKLGLVFLAYGVFGGHLARAKSRSLGRDFPVLRIIADKKKTTTHELVLRWLRWKSPAILPIVGARTSQHLPNRSLTNEEPLLSNEDFLLIDNARLNKETSE